MDKPHFQFDLSLKTGVAATFMLSQKMQIALRVLQMTQSELHDWLDLVAVENPLLEKEDYSHPPTIKNAQSILENSLIETTSLASVLLAQGREQLPEMMDIVTVVVGNLDDRGFLTATVEEIAEQSLASCEEVEAVKYVMHEFEPLGVCATCVQESLLFQLSYFGSDLGFEIVLRHYDDLLHKRYETLAKKMGMSEKRMIEVINEEIIPLNPYPGLQFQPSDTVSVTPEVVIQYDEGEWEISLPNHPMPKLVLIEVDETDQSPLWNKYKNEAEWVLRVIKERKATLLRIAKGLIEHHADYFKGDEDSPEPLTMKTFAKKLSLHESTVSRAISDKWIEIPIGFLPIKQLFSKAIRGSDKDVSREKAQRLLKSLINQENRSKPMPDELLSQLMLQEGIPISRRTVAKYRGEMEIPSHQMRRREE